MSGPAFITKEQLRALLVVNARHGGTVRLSGRDVPWQPVSVGDWCRHVLARFEAPQALYVLLVQQTTRGEELAAAEREGRDPDPALLAVDTAGYARAQARDAAAANAAMVACGLGFPGDAEAEALILGADDAEFYAALETIEEGSWGDDPADFFGRAARSASGRGLVAMLKAAARKATTEPSTSRTDGSTPTAGTETTPNRKARRTAKAKSGSRRGSAGSSGSSKRSRA